MKTQKLRYLILFLFLALMTWLGYKHQILGGGPAGSPSVDSMCPFGGLEGIYSYLRDGVWLRRLAPSALVLFTAVTVMTLLLGRVFCGWICPMGAITEFTSRLARKLGLPSRRLPERLDFWLRGLKYVILVVVLFGTWRFGTLVFREYDPWKAWMHLSAGFNEGLSALLVLAGVIIAEFFVERFWCRYLCPLGAAFGVMQKVSRNKIVRDPAVCINCKKCDRSCPTGLTPSQSLILPSADCIACGKCVDVCPKQKAIGFKFLGRFELTPAKVGIIGVCVFAIFWGGSKLTGIWTTQAPPPPVGIQVNPADQLYGWMDLNTAAKIMNIAPQQVLEISGLPSDTPLDVSMKKLPGEPDDLIIASLAAWHEQNKKSVTLPNIEEIRGSATLAQVADTYGLKTDDILLRAGWPAGLDPNVPLKEHAGALGREVSEIRDAVRALVKEK